MKPFTFSGVLLVNILLSLFLGYKLDEWLNTTPIFIIVGLIYSVVGSIYILLHKANKQKNRNLFSFNWNKCCDYSWIVV